MDKLPAFLQTVTELLYTVCVQIFKTYNCHGLSGFIIEGFTQFSIAKHRTNHDIIAFCRKPSNHEIQKITSLKNMVFTYTHGIAQVVLTELH